MSGLTLELFVGNKRAAEIRKQFDYLDEDIFENEYFIEYKGYVYAMSDFIRISPNPGDALLGWHGVAADSCFSGVLIKQCENGDVIMGRYFS